jgi:hypothetical protein
MNAEQPSATIDHLVIVAPSLQSGSDYVGAKLGVTPQPGGEHAAMGTHNALVRLGDALYLEVIAVNPDAPQPNRARWFELDRLGPDATPRLATWVARTTDIRAAVSASPLSLGRIEPMTRGSFRWLVTLPEDGSLPAHGIAPTLIQWLTEPHPANRLVDSGCALVGLEWFHAEAERIGALLTAIHFAGDVTVWPIAPHETPRLVAHIQTRHGIRRLGDRK